MYKIRAAQIDLNRQKETFDFFKLYVDFLVDSGYNTLMFYIAWRLRLPSHPFPSPEEAYDAEQIRSMVDYARSQGLDVIPTTNLTYVTSLLKYEGMQKYLEQGSRFWGDQRGNFCNSNPEVYDFIERYLGELAELVPSEYLHIGGDEAWDTAFCDKCMGDDFDFAKEERSYVSFMLRCIHVVKHKLGRRCIMWDDMLEQYPRALAQLPRDLIMAHWQYQDDCYSSVSHFGLRKRINSLAEYERLGFDYLLCPAVYSSCNARSLSRFAPANSKHLLGGIMTVWRAHVKLIYRDLPSLAYVGRFWEKNNPQEDLLSFKQSMARLLQCEDDLLFAALRSYTEKHYAIFNSFLSENALLCYDFNGLDFSSYANIALQLEVLQEKQALVQGELGQRVIKEIIVCLELQQAGFELKENIRDYIYGIRNPDSAQKMQVVLQRLRYLAARYAEMWELWRGGIQPNVIKLEFDSILEKLHSIIERVLQGRYLKLLFCLPEEHGAMHSKLSIHTGGEKRPVASGVFKGSPVSSTYFERVFLLESDEVPESVELETCGYGGQGLCYVSAELQKQKYLPVQVQAQGKVQDPQFVMDDDCKVCWMGEPDSDLAWQNREISAEISSVTVKLARKNREMPTDSDPV